MKRIAVSFILFCAISFIVLYPVLKKRSFEQVEDKNFRILTERATRRSRAEGMPQSNDVGAIRESRPEPFEDAGVNGEDGADAFDLLDGMAEGVVDIVDWVEDNVVSRARRGFDIMGSEASHEDSTSTSKEEDDGFKIFTDRARVLGRSREGR